MSASHDGFFNLIGIFLGLLSVLRHIAYRVGMGQR